VLRANSQSTHPGALTADLYCADGGFQIANWGFYKDARVGNDLTIESDFARRKLYTGPLVRLFH
jgi:complement component 1 Q subcomponent-binding protein